MNYKLPDFDYTKLPKVFVGDRSRWATATAVSFVSDNLALIASFYGKKIYLLDLENQQILNEVDTINYPDLMDYKNGLIAIAERNDDGKLGNIGLYTLENNQITHKKEINFTKYNELHGIRILDDNEIIFTDKLSNKGVHIMNLNTDEIKSFTNFNFPPCDVFILSDRIMVITSETKPNFNGLKNYNTKLSYLHLLEFPSFNELSKISFEGQVDCITYENGVGFITIQSNDSLYHFELKEDKLLGIGEIKKDFSFPHGIAMKNGKICVTNYGTNSVSIFNLEEII